jgi:ABC-type lipoprotein export system ATPase subunit
MPTADDPVLAATGLYHIYREALIETVALRGADLTLRAGTWTSLMGPSGSGKSTLVHIITGLLEPSGGSVMIEGQDITRLHPADRARMRRALMGLVLQRDNLHPLLDAEENVALPLRLDGRPRREARPAARRLLDEMGLPDRATRMSGQLSGGEAQRVAIAIALAAGPRMIVADEPTGELDEKTAAGVLDLLDGVRKAEGTAVLTVTHNPQVAERATTRLLMHDGLISVER